MGHLQLAQGVTYDAAEHQIYMHRCPKCLRENYVFNVLQGVCCWCGYDAKELIPKNDNKVDV